MNNLNAITIIVIELFKYIVHDANYVFVDKPFYALTILKIAMNEMQSFTVY